MCVTLVKNAVGSIKDCLKVYCIPSKRLQHNTKTPFNYNKHNYT